MAAGVGLGDSALGTRHDSGRGPPGRPPDGSAGGEGQEALRPAYENDREVARLGATLRLPDGCADDPGDRVRALLSRLGRLKPPSSECPAFTVVTQPLPIGDDKHDNDDGSVVLDEGSGNDPSAARAAPGRPSCLLLKLVEVSSSTTPVPPYE